MTQYRRTDAVSELWAANNLDESLVAQRTQCLCASLTAAATAVLFHTSVGPQLSGSETIQGFTFFKCDKLLLLIDNQVSIQVSELTLYV